MNKKILVVLTVFVALVAVVVFFSFSANAQVPGRTSSHIMPETAADAAELFDIEDESRLSRLGGNGWLMEQGLTETLTLPRYFLAGTPLGVFSATNTTTGTMTTPPVDVASIYLDGDYIHYPEADHSLIVSGTAVVGEEVTINLNSTGAIAPAVTEVLWDISGSVYTTSVVVDNYITHTFETAGLQLMSANLNNEWGEVIYEVFPVEVMVEEAPPEPTVFEVFLSIIAKTPNYETIQGYCLSPDELQEKVGGEAQYWERIDTNGDGEINTVSDGCGYNYTNWEGNDVPLVVHYFTKIVTLDLDGLLLEVLGGNTHNSQGQPFSFWGLDPH